MEHIIRRSKKKHIMKAFLISIFLIIGQITYAQSNFRAPWKNKFEHRLSNKGKNSNNANNKILNNLYVSILPFFFYQYLLSPIDGRDCPSFPSCSEYALISVRKYGLGLGSLFTADRLLHEADEIHLAPLILTDRGIKCYDPIEENDFWFKQ